MSRATSLESIIRLLHEDEKEEVGVHSKQRVIEFDPSTKRVVEESSSTIDRLKNMFRGKNHYYVVQPEVSVDYMAQSYDLGNALRGVGSFEVKIRCFLHLPHGEEARLVKAVAEAGGVGALVDGLIEKGMSRYAWKADSRGDDALSSLLTKEAEWEEEVARLLRARSGLEGNFTFALARQAEKVSLREQEVEVSVRKSDEWLRVTYGVDLEPENQRMAMMNHERVLRLPELLKEETQRWFRSKVDLNEYCNHQAEVRKNHQSMVSEYVAGLGYRLAWHTLHLAVDFDLPREDLYIFGHDCKILDHEPMIRVRHELMVRVEDIQEYRAARITDLGQWLDDNLQEVGRSILFNTSYSRLATRFKRPSQGSEQHSLEVSLEEKIRDEIVRRARAIGCGVMQHSSTPDIPEVGGLTGFELPELKLKMRPKDGGDSSVKVGISVHGRLRDLTKIEHKIRPGSPLTDQMKKFIASSARQYMHGVTSREFYLGFEPADGEETTSTLEERLGEHLQARFTQEFHADCSVTVRPEGTSFTDRWKQIQRKRPGVSVELRSQEGFLVGFSMRFQVTAVSVDDWATYLQRGTAVDEEMEEISKLVRSQILSTCDRVFPKQLLAFETVQGREQLKKAMLQGIPGRIVGVEEVVRELHGVNIRVFEFVRSESDFDRSLAQLTAGKIEANTQLQLDEMANHTERIRSINQRILELQCDPHGDPGEMEHLIKVKQSLGVDFDVTEGADSIRALPLGHTDAPEHGVQSPPDLRSFLGPGPTSRPGLRGKEGDGVADHGAVDDLAGQSSTPSSPLQEGADPDEIEVEVEEVSDELAPRAVPRLSHESNGHMNRSSDSSDNSRVSSPEEPLG